MKTLLYSKVANVLHTERVSEKVSASKFIFNGRVRPAVYTAIIRSNNAERFRSRLLLIKRTCTFQKPGTVNRQVCAHLW